MPAKKAAAATKMTIVEPKGVEKKKNTAAQKGEKKSEGFKKRLAALFQARPKEWITGVSMPPKRDLTHFVKWPKYVRLARQKRVLLNRLKCPPAINMFNHTLDKATAVNLFKLMAKMRPEEEAARRQRRIANAKRLAEVMKPAKEGEKVDMKARRAAHKQLLKEMAAQNPIALRYGLNNVTHLITRNKAQLVVIASDVDPIELVLWLPALCRKKKVPYCIVKNKARLGQLVHHKTASVVAITDTPKELRADFTQLVDAIKPQFLDNAHLLREWGEPVLGLKHNAREAKRQRRIARVEAAKK
jgi:large subunit ribosomal protein L7Ae